jgi:alpha-tubulin suppressor-like RCC1 family protein
MIHHSDWVKSKITMLSAGQWHSCVVTQDGKAYTWGYNAQGQLASTTVPLSENGRVPSRALNNDDFITMAACGSSSTIVVASTCLQKY